MKVLDLQCGQDHRFEAWFGSEDDYTAQLARGLLSCPLCNDAAIRRVPSAPRLNLSGAQAPSAAEPKAPASEVVAGEPDLQAAWLAAVRQLVARTDDVGPRFAEEARRIHYGEAPQRGIRGQASPEQRAALREEGIDTVAIAVPEALKHPLQ